MPAATLTLSDSVSRPIGMRTTTSQRSRTSLDRPVPSAPTTSATGSAKPS
jgi:hypothetical protein